MPREIKDELLGAIGAAVRTHRVRCGLPQAQLAQRAGIPSGVVGRIERGNSDSSMLTLLCIAAALGVTGADLLGSAGL